ncbi:unnamed protein product [Candida parapsilosis]
MQPTSIVASFTFIVTLACGFLFPGYGAVLETMNKLLPGKYHQQIAPADPTFEEYKANLINLNKVVPHHYIVIFNEDLSQSQVEQYTQWLQVEYNNMLTIVDAAPKEVQVLKKLEFFNVEGFFRGFTGFFTADVISKIKNDPHVKLVEQDAIFKTNEFDIQKDAPWGIHELVIARMKKRESIKVEHEEFEGRAQWGDAIAFPKIKIDGHGMEHTVQVQHQISSKELSMSQQHQEDVKSRKAGFKGSVVNMSIGGGVSEALDLAVNAAVKAGLHVAVAAGNDDADCLSILTCQSGLDATTPNILAYNGAAATDDFWNI